MLLVNKSRTHFAITLILIVAATALFFVLAGSVLAVDRTPNDGQVPFYARFGIGEIFDDGEWTTIIFYRSPECIPEEFNMMEFFHFPTDTDPGAFACQPATTDGYEIWEGEPGAGPAPKRAYLRGRGAVPVWFVNSDELSKIDSDGVVTIDELLSLDPLTGTASSYYEILHPTQSNDRPVVIFRAAGDLDEGGSFVARASYVNGEGSTGIQIDQ